MKLRGTLRNCFLISLLMLWPAVPAGGQNLQQALAGFVETPAVPGYEQALAGEIRARLKGFALQSDNLGNLSVTLGSGAPHRLVVAPMDEPAYVVSGITDDGYLRVQRLPQTAPHAVFDLLHAAQPVMIYTRKGKWVSGVVAGLSTHLQGGRLNPPRVSHPDEMYIDIGARSAAEVHRAGVGLLDPLALDRKLYEMGFGRVTGVSVGDRFGCASLVELLRRLDPGKLRGMLTVAFVVQQWADGRGLERVLARLAAEKKVDEVIYVGRLLPRRATLSGAPARSAEMRGPRGIPGGGVSIGVADPEAPLSGLAQELEGLGEANKIVVTPDFSAPLPRSRYGPPETVVPPEHFVHLGIATKFPVTPAEYIDLHDLVDLTALLEAYVQGTPRAETLVVTPPLPPPPLPERPRTAPPATAILQKLVETYGVSGSEAAVRETIARLLPPWAKSETDSAGNLVLRLGSAPTSPKARRIVFVAHMDEIGYVVRSIAAGGALEVESRGGGISQFFVGHPVFIHTAAGIRPGVLALPSGWEAPGFQWPRGGQAAWRVETGARSAAEVEQLGIKAGDSVTVPKTYRHLFDTRANARSFDDRVGCAALVAAVWALGPALPGRDVTFIWSTEEEVGLRGALAAARRLAQEGRAPDYVFAVDTFVSSDSPLESKRFADALVGSGFVIRAVDNSNIAPRRLVDRLVQLARANKIAVQSGVTGGGNDGAVFLRYGSTDLPLGWPLRYSHSPGEVIDTRDLEALGQIVAAVARSW